MSLTAARAGKEYFVVEFLSDFARSFFVFRHEADFQGRMLPGALLRFAQQVATDHCNAMGVNDELYARTHTAFLLVRQTLEFHRIPHVDETLRFVTTSQMPQRAAYKRITLVTDEAGQEVACVDSRWVLVDTERRHILRKAPPELQLPWPERVDRELDVSLPARPENMEPAVEIHARYTQCDMNGHLNNTRYADLACDLVPVEELRSAAVRRMTIHYHKEIPMGQTAAMTRAKGEDGSWWITGWREDKPCFDVRLWLG